MGCDMHYWVEVKDSEGNWQPSRAMFPSPWATDLVVGSGTKLEQEAGHFVPSHWDADPSSFAYKKISAIGTCLSMARNYVLFSLLAGVRNRHNGITPLYAARGFPTDASAYVDYDYHACAEYVHTPSYLTLAELYHIPWEEGGVETYRVQCSWFVDTFLPVLKKLHTDPNCVRLVFWFDS